jgi:tetratricopeptide (TPR) repeat protein
MSIEKYNEAVENIKERKFKDALLLLAELLTEEEPYEKLHYYIGICYINLEYLNDADKEFEEALKENLSLEDKIYTYLLLGFINSRLNEPVKAITYLKSCLKYDKENPKAYSCLGYCYYQKGEHEKAIDYFRKGLKKNKDNPNIKNSLGYTMLENDGDINEAANYINSAVKSAPKNPAYLDSLAWVHYKSKRYATAFNVISQAIKLAPDNPVIKEHFDLIKEKTK